jgi:hypothetical protein
MATHDDLRLLSIFHYVLAGLSSLFCFFPLIYIGLGVALMSGALDDAKGHAPPAFVGALVFAIGLFILLLGVLFVACLIAAGRFLAQRRRWLFCVIVAAISCTFTPFGTILGVFTLVVLSRAETKALFQQPAPGPAAGSWT